MLTALRSVAQSTTSSLHAGNPLSNYDILSILQQAGVQNGVRGCQSSPPRLEPFANNDRAVARVHLRVQHVQ